MTKNDGIFIEDQEPREIWPVERITTRRRIENLLHKIDPRNRSLSAASVANVRNVLTSEQMKDCAEAYMNNGIVRATVDKTAWFIQGPNTKFTIEPNQESLEGLDDKEVIQLEEDIRKKYKELRADIVRINKRCELHDRLTKFIIHEQVFGQAYLEINRNKKGIGTGTNTFPIYGEPMALKVLNPLRIEDKIVNAETYEFEGIIYNFGTQVKNSTGDKKKKIPSTSLVSGWHDDANLFDNTYYSGSSPVWSILSASQVIETILDENLPEFVKGIAEGTGAIYTGTNKESITKQIKDALKHSTFFLHNQEKLRIDELNIARDPQEITGIIDKLARYICQSLSLPLFLLFEDTANFATANQVMQTYKVTTVFRYRQWLSNLLEKYWYDPIIADWFNIDIDDVISQEIRIKPFFEDLNFETNLDIITGVEKMINLDIYNRVDGAKAVHNREVAARLILEGAAAQDEEMADIKLQQEKLGLEGQEKSNQQIGKQPPVAANANSKPKQQPNK